MTAEENTTLQKIMAEGRSEFLEKGFKDASLRNIVKRAGVTTGAFYGYFDDKEALFKALAGPSAEGLISIFLTAHRDFEKLPKDVQQRIVYEYADPYQKELISYIYDHFDEFKLLVTCAGGTAYADFINTLVDVEVASTLGFIHATGNDALDTGRVTPELLHIISSAFFSAVFEIVAHDMTRDAADSYIDSLTRFFTAGWKAILET